MSYYHHMCNSAKKQVCTYSFVSALSYETSKMFTTAADSLNTLDIKVSSQILIIKEERRQGLMKDVLK